MGASQPLLHSARTTRIHRIFRGPALGLIAMLGGTLLLPTAHAQTTQVSLVTLVTDQSSLNLSNHFGMPDNAVVNQNGDYAFTGEGVTPTGGGGTGSALFLRLHGASTATRLLQFGDPLPGLAGATAAGFNLGGLNQSANLAFAVDYTVSPPDGRLHRAILIYNSGTNSYSTVASSDAVAAGSGGQTFGPSLTFPVVGRSLDDNGDVFLTTTFEPFQDTDTVPNEDTFYVALAGGTPVRVVGLGDPVPGETSTTFVSLNSASQINSLGQFLFAAQGFNGTTTVNGLFLGSASGGVGSVTKVVATGDPKPPGVGIFSPAANFAGNQAALNDLGQVAFVDPHTQAVLPVITPSVWLYTAGVLTNPFNGPLPNSPAAVSVTLNGLSDLGDAVGTVTLSGVESIVRIHSSGVIDTVASTGQAAPGTTTTFSSFSNTSLIDNNDRVIFAAFFSAGGTGIYQQTGTAASQPVVLGGQSSGLSGGGTISAAGALKALDNGSTFFSADILGGTANLAQYLGTPGNLQALMSTADTLPAGARTRLYLPTSSSGNSNNNSLFVAFAANLAGGQTAIFVRDILAGTTARVVSEGDVIPGFSGATFVRRAASSSDKPFYMNGNGQVVFPVILSTGLQAILLAGPSANSVTTAAATGSIVAVTGNPTLISLDFSDNTTALSPINDSSQVAFYGTLSTGVSGIFLFDGGTNIFEIAVTGEGVPEGGATFTNLSSNCNPTCSLGINQNGQVVFGALKSGGGSGLYIGSAFGPPTKVVASGDFLPGSTTVTFGPLNPISGFNNSGQVVFEAANGGGVFTGSGNGATPTAVATDGTANPGTGGGTLATSTPSFSVTNFSNFFNTTNAAIDDSGDVVFQSRVTGGTPNSGYFRVVNNGGTLGPLQATVLQGQMVTGAGALGTMFPSFLNSSFFSLGNNGNGNSGTDFIFTNSFTNTSGTMVGVGQFLSVGSNGVLKLMAPGDLIAGTGGGVYSTGTIRLQSHQDTPVYEVLTASGTASQALVLAVTNIGTVATTTTLVSSQNPTGIGFPTQFTATVTTSSQGLAPANDIVAFFDNGVAIGASSTDTNGQATFITSSLTAGSHTITAEYFPNSSSEGLLTSTSSPLTQVVSNATSTLLFSTQNPSAPGTTVLLEVVVESVAPSSSIPTGTVTFLDSTTQIGTGTLNSEVATFSTSSLATGTHSITAQYSGDSNFAASMSNPVSQLVQTSGSGPGPSATALASSVNPSVAGQTVAFTAPVSGSAGGTPTGTVTFLDGATLIGTGAIVSGQATFSTSSLSVGSHSITAVYGGDSNFSGSTSNVVTQVVQAATSGTLAVATTSLPVGSENVFYSSALTATGGVSPYTWVMTSGSLPTGLNLSASGVIGGTPTASGTFNFVVKVTDSVGSTATSSTLSISVAFVSAAATCAGAPSGQESVLFGRWVAMLQGWQSTSPGSPAAAVFSFSANGGGLFNDVTGGGVTGNIDGNFGANSANSAFSGNILTAGSSYSVGLDPINGTGYVGCMTLLNSISGTPEVLRFALSVPSGGTAVSGRIIYWIDATGTGSGTRASGLMLPQDATAFSGGTLANLKPNYAFGEDGSDPTGGHLAIAGNVGLNTATGQFTGTLDSNDAGTVSASQTLSGTFTGLSSTTGRALITSTFGGNPSTHTAMYIVNANELFVVGIDPFTTNTIYSGRAIATGTSFSNTSLSGNYVLQAAGSTTGNSSCNNSGPCSTVALGVLGFSNGTINSASTIFDYVSGTAPQTGNASGTYSVAASGRVTLIAGNHSPVLYLATPQPNTEPVTAFVVGTDSPATFGEIEAGANSNVSPGAMAGNYIAGNIDPGDSTVSDEATVAHFDSLGNITGYQSKSQIGGLTSGSINSGGTAGALTITNSPLPGFGTLGDSTTIAVTNGTRIWFIDTGGSDTSPARITIIEPAALASPPTIQSLSTSSGPVGTPITITGANFGATQGTSTVTVNGVSVGTVPNSNWSSTSISVTVPGGATGTGQVVVTVLGAASNGVTFTVATSLLPTATALSSSVNPSVLGQSVTFSATVDGSGVGTPTGTVTFLDGTTVIGAFPLSGGVVATFSTSSLAIGSHSITAAYSGDTNFSGSTSNLVIQVVQTASLKPSATALSSSVNPSVVGQSVTFSATVAGAGTTPTGTVTFLDGAATLGTGALNASGVATFSTSSLAAGSHSITAAYSGDANFSGSTSNLVTQRVTPNTTATTLISSLDPSISSQPVEFSAIVTSSSGGTPTGNVTFFDGASQIGTGTLNATGVATFTTSSLAVGPHSITAQFIGGAIFVGSTSTALTQTVTINPTATVLISSLNPSNSTQFVQFTAIVSSSTGATPAGSVTFLDGSNQIGTGTLNASGQATFGISSLSVASHSITAQYPGTANFGPSTSAAVTQVVNPTSNPITNPTTAPTFVALGSSPNPSAVGQSVLITATVSSSISGTPTGNVNFLDNGTSIGTGALNGSGVATFTTSSLGSGFHPLTAQYFGDSDFAPSFSSLLTQTVGSPTPQVSVQITPIPQNVASCATACTPIQFTATVLNAGTNTAVTWVLAGPGSIDQTGKYTPPSSASSTATVAIIVTSKADTSKTATITFTIAADALSYGGASQPPSTIAPGSQFMATIQLNGPPSSGINSTVPFVLSCANLPVGVTCAFNPPTVTGANPSFNVTFSSTGSSGTASVNIAPWWIEPAGPWYALIAVFLSALAIAGSRNRALFGRRGYACTMLVLMCLSAAFLTSCTASTQQSVPVPVVAAVTPAGNYQAVVVATPQNSTGNFVQTQLIVPFVVN